MKSTETIIDQVNIVQDEASDVLILGKKNNLKRLLSGMFINKFTAIHYFLLSAQLIFVLHEILKLEIIPKIIANWEMYSI